MAKQKLKDRDDPKAARSAGEQGTAGAHGTAESGGHGAAKAHGQPAVVDASLPATRSGLLALHADTRRARNAAAHGSPEHRAAVDLIGRIEVRIAAIERAQDPPLV